MPRGIREIEREEAVKSKKVKKARWPTKTPNSVLSVCKEYWKGTASFSKYRIRFWNKHSVLTFVPAHNEKGCCDNSVRFPCCFVLLSREDVKDNKPLATHCWWGKFTLKFVIDDLKSMQVQ